MAAADQLSSITVYNGASGAGQSVCFPRIPKTFTFKQFLEKCNKDARVRTALKMKSREQFTKLEIEGNEMEPEHRLGDHLKDGDVVHLVKPVVGGKK